MPALAEVSFRFAVCLCMLECGATWCNYYNHWDAQKQCTETNCGALVQKMDFDVRVRSSVYLCFIATYRYY